MTLNIPTFTKSAKIYKTLNFMLNQVKSEEMDL